MKSRKQSCTEQEFLDHQSAYDGICTTCGEWSCGGVEDDAENYECEECGEFTVFGAGQALIAGILDIEMRAQQ